MAIQISGTTVIDNSRNLTNIANATSSATTANTYVIRTAAGKICANGVDIPLNALTPLGSQVEGGFLLCKSSNIGWIVAPKESEVSRTWHARNDAITRAQAVTGCSSGWFIPTLSQLENPGYVCRQYWDSYTATSGYWSSTERNSYRACARNICNGVAMYAPKYIDCCARAFRCVSY